MRDLKLSGKNKPEFMMDIDITLITKRVRDYWPGATGEGSCGAYSWAIPSEEGGETVVAEAWMHVSRGWWLRIRKPEGAKK